VASGVQAKISISGKRRTNGWGRSRAEGKNWTSGGGNPATPPEAVQAHHSFKDNLRHTSWAL